MRDYALTSAEMNGALTASPLDLLRNWLARRRLAQLPASALAERGITEADRSWVLSLTLDCDPGLALADRLASRLRQAARR